MQASVPWFRSLAWKSFRGSALALLTVTAVVLLVVRQQSRARAWEEGRAALRASAQVLDHQLGQEMRVLEAGLELFALQSWTLSNLDQAMQRGDVASATDTLQQNLPSLRAEMAVLTGPDGRRFTGTLPGSPEETVAVTALQMALDPEAARDAGQAGPGYRGFMRGEGKELFILVTRPLVLPGGTRFGALGVGLRLGDDRARQLLDLVAAGSGHLAFLTQGQVAGSTLPAPERTRLEAFLRSSEAAAAFSEVRQGRRSAPFRLSLEGIAYLLTISPLRGQDGATLGTATVRLQPLDPFLAPFQRIQGTVLAAALAGLLLAVLFTLLGTRRITAPLARLTAAANELARGGQADLETSWRDDEVGALTRAFQHLQGELRARDELLSHLERLRGETGGDLGTAPIPSRVSLPGMELDATAYIPDPEFTGQVRPTAARVRLREGELFDQRYRIDAILGRGGMGVVFKAYDLQLEEDVAVKVIHPDHALTPEFLVQLKQEIKLARRITHRHVLRTHDFGEARGVPYVTMEYLKGVTLHQLLEDRGRLPLPLTLRIARQVAEGLAAAHAEGVVHRDVKPHNVFFDLKGDVKLLDFGLAAPVAAEMGGHLFGTPRYMAPEQVRGEAVDPRTDLYAFGVMLFELAAGEVPFLGDGVTAQLRMHLEAPVPSLAERLPDLPPAFTGLVKELLAKRKEDRPGSAAEVALRLQGVARDLESTHWVG